MSISMSIAPGSRESRVSRVSRISRISRVRSEHRSPLKKRNTEIQSQFGSFQEMSPNNFGDYFTQLCSDQLVAAPIRIQIAHVKEYREDSGDERIKERKKSARLDKMVIKSQLNLVVRDANIILKMARKNLQKIVFRNFKMDSSVMKILSTCLNYHPMVDSLQFINCNLNCETIIILSTILESFTNILEVIIHFNPYNGPSLSRLIQSTALQYLEIKFCRLTDSSIQCIAEELRKPSTPLLMLNLASNNITDDGVLFFTKMLRINRYLVALNLSNNCLTDISAVELSMVLREFPLEIDELVLRRMEVFNRLKIKKGVIKEYEELLVQTMETKPSKQRSPKRGAPSAHFKETRSTKPILDERAREKYIETMMPQITHPFLLECTVNNGEILCYGNLSLSHLNLSYNKITSQGISSLIGALSYQVGIMNKVDQKGLCRLIIDGNILSSSDSDVRQELNDVLLLKNQHKVSEKRVMINV